MHPPYSLLNSHHYLVSVSNRITIKVGLITFLMTVKLSPGIRVLKNLLQQSDVNIGFAHFSCMCVHSECVCSGLTDLHVANFNLQGTDMLCLCSSTFLRRTLTNKYVGGTTFFQCVDSKSFCRNGIKSSYKEVEPILVNYSY